MIALAAERDRLLMIAKLARARGRLAIASGDTEGARRAFEQALAATERRPMPYERALVELSYGEFLRRLRERRAASAQLGAARSVLERLGAGPALERCERELRAAGCSRRSAATRTLAG